MSFKIVSTEQKFYFKGCCPYCSGRLVAQADSWELQEDGTWMAEHFDVNCLNEPKDIMSEEWDEFTRIHSDMPYVYWLPVVSKIEQTINKQYRFNVEEIITSKSENLDK